MSQIRIPKSAEPLLPFCRKSMDAADNACFDTYADLVTFAASCGYHSLQGRQPSRVEGFLAIPNAIDLAIFENQKLLPALLLIGLATTGDYQIARNDESLCQLIEGCADRGSKILVHNLSDWTTARFHIETASALIKAKEDNQKDAI